MSPPSATIASNSFISWVREGVATTVTGGSAANVPRRAAVTVGLDVNLVAINGVSAQLYGPGDVVGLDPRVVVRTTPHHGSTDFEPNHFPAVEFAQPSLPWLFTPIGASGQKLLPWICLAVVRKQDGVTFEAPDPKQPLPVLAFRGPARPLEELPPLDEAWAWAHGHVSWAPDPAGPAAETTQRLGDLLRDSPQQTMSRLICPRRLEPGAQYYACVVPVFDLGVKAGLGLATAEDDTVGTLQLAWRSDAPPPLPFFLPVYYRWEFTAGSAGDFESLVRHIVGRTDLPRVGERAMDVSHAGPTELEMPGVILGLEGALRPAGMGPTAWDWAPAMRASFERSLTPLLDAPASPASTAPPAGAPIVPPPLYGRSQTGQNTVPTPNQPYEWLRALNLDPRARAAAAFGTAVVQRDQEQLMASAWAQLAEVRPLNRMLRQTQLAREIGAVTHRKRLAALSPAATIAVTRPALARVGTFDLLPAGLRTVAGLRSDAAEPKFQTFTTWIADSAITAGAVSSAFQAISRPGGPVAKRLPTPATTIRSDVVNGLNEKSIVAAPPRIAPDGTQSVDVVSNQLAGEFGDYYRDVRFRAAAPDLFVFDSAGNTNMEGWADLWEYHNQPAQPLTPLADPSAVSSLMRARDDYEPTPPRLPPRGPGRTALNTAFARAALAHQQYLLKALDLVDKEAEKLSHDLGVMKSQLLASLDPEKTLPRRAEGQVAGAPEQLWKRHDPLDPVLASPRYDQPMSEPLRQLSPDLLLPGVEHVQPDTIAVLEPNHAFIEAYLVGLNQEMSNELLWRGYPGDLGATYFRHFWNTRAALSHSRECPDGADVKPVAEWRDGPLGQHACGASATSPLVLLLRSEALRRYPSATIYVVKAVGSGNELVPGTAEEYPLFQEVLAPDIALFGFAITEQQARGSGDSEDLGYYFVIQQHASAPVFGLAAAKSPGSLGRWSALSWDDLPRAAPDQPPTYVRVGTQVPTPVPPDVLTWAQNAAHMAGITLRPAVRVARHLSSILAE